jgi:hypothetical protein
MHIIRDSILGFVMLSVISVQNTVAQNITPQLPSDTNQQPVESTAYPTENWNSGLPATVDEPSSKPQTPDENQRNVATDTIRAIDDTAKPTITRPVNSTSPESIASPGRQERFLRMGIGFQCGIKFHQPEDINDFITAIWNSYLAEKVYVPVDKKNIGPGVLLAMNGTIDIGSFFQMTPFAQGMWAGKQFQFRGDPVGDIYFNTYTAVGGLNLWVHLVNRERFSIRLGAGGYATYTIVRLTGDVSHARVSGGGYGFRGLLGTELRLNSKAVLTLDGGVPYGKSRFHTEDGLKIAGTPINYPTEFKHFGFELCPGMMFYF